MSGTIAFQAFVERTRAHVERALDAWLPSPPACPALVADAMRYSVMAGGKRLRPLLTLAVADAVHRSDSNRATELALPAACAVEFIHTYSLIHDDLPAMDDDDLRRGRPTLHVVYNDAVAILAGDALQAEAFKLIAREPQPDSDELRARKLRAIERLAHAAGADGMVGGQAIDIQAAGQVAGHGVRLDGAALQAMHLRKTGALIEAAAANGAIMCGAPDPAVAAVCSWARELGLAFQIVDDILDVEGSAATLGKTAGKDAANDKPTYPALFGLDRSRAMAAECAERAREALTAGLADAGWLHEIADWVLHRRS